MGFNVKVLSRLKARHYSYNLNMPKCVIISISDCDADRNIFCDNPQILDILYIQFEDSLENIDGRGFNVKIAQSIVTFVNKWKDKVSDIIIHCNEGLSRSAAIAASLLYKYNNKDDSVIFNDFTMCPNMFVYQVMLTVMGFNIMTSDNMSSKFSEIAYRWGYSRNYDLFADCKYFNSHKT